MFKSGDRRPATTQKTVLKESNPLPSENINAYWAGIVVRDVDSRRQRRSKRQIVLNDDWCESATRKLTTRNQNNRRQHTNSATERRISGELYPRNKSKRSCFRIQYALNSPKQKIKQQTDKLTDKYIWRLCVWLVAWLKTTLAQTKWTEFLSPQDSLSQKTSLFR